jgi:hypothetical protein
LVIAFAATVAAGLPRPARAQLPVPASSAFDVTGFIQEATLDPACAANAHCGGALRVNGQLILVPEETIVIFPASALTWQETFAQAPLPYGLAAAPGPETGMAMNDVPAPLTTYEAHVVGNRVVGGGTDRYVAGLVYVAQHSLSSGAGFINFIDYATGTLRVGGTIGDGTTGTRVRLNDPAGRYGRASSPDPRFTVDSENPTIQAGTGFPMCVPRTDPAVADDPLCPQGNRPVVAAGPPPVYLTNIQMNDPVALPGILPDATRQAPFEVGDYVTFSGILVTDSAAAPTTGPLPANGAAGTWVAAHTIVNNVAIYTWPGRNPAYVSTEVTLIGTGGLTVLGAGEAAVRTRFEGMSTDPSRNVHLYGIDLDPLTGAPTDRDWGTTGVDPGPPTGAVKGRWRFRPPCTAAAATDKACTPPPVGTFLPPTREVRAVVEGAWDPFHAATLYANGLMAGQYHAPILEYVFPENVPGSPIVENNFNTIPFLAQGGYTSSAGTLVGQLSPWPSSVQPAPACTPAVAGPGGPYTAPSGGSITLAGSASGTAPVTLAWTVSAGTLSAPTSASPTFTAPVTGVQLAVTATLVASNACGSSSASTTITVNAALAPTVAGVAPITVFSGSGGGFTASGSDPGGLPLTFTVVQAGVPALANLTVTPVSAWSASVAFSAPVLPLGQVTSTTVTLTVTATSSAGVSSAPATVTVTVKPLPDSVLITATEYRTSKQRLVVNASSSVVSPNVVLTLQPYLTTQGVVFDPSTLGNVFTNNGGGLYILTLVGAPEPAVPPATPLVVISNLGGASPPHGLDKIRL